MAENHAVDTALESVLDSLRVADPNGSRVAQVLRDTFDQLYDGQRTGRYRWDQLFKTEKTHFGTLFEINLRRVLSDVISDGVKLDYRIADHEIDCKYSFQIGGWMLPPECINELLLVCTASDTQSEWALGVVRARPELLRPGKNRDLKTGLSLEGRQSIRWIQWGAPLPPNVLLDLDQETIEAIFGHSSGQKRINTLFRRVTDRRIGRNTVATVAQQDDYMKRVRYNGGARSSLRNEGFIILGGDFSSHQQIARELGVDIPGPGEFVSVRVISTDGKYPLAATIDGSYWRRAEPLDPVETAPLLTHLKK